jgi:GNAT superfamily N-acetyltransferase
MKFKFKPAGGITTDVNVGRFVSGRSEVEFEYTTDWKNAWILSLHVVKSRRRQGVATELLGHLFRRMSSGSYLNPGVFTCTGEEKDGLFRVLSRLSRKHHVKLQL